jgi:hypothetical protein
MRYMPTLKPRTILGPTGSHRQLQEQTDLSEVVLLESGGTVTARKSTKFPIHRLHQQTFTTKHIQYTSLADSVFGSSTATRRTHRETRLGNPSDSTMTRMMVIPHTLPTFRRIVHFYANGPIRCGRTCCYQIFIMALKLRMCSTVHSRVNWLFSWVFWHSQ